jgi:hypothetical protein
MVNNITNKKMSISSIKPPPVMVNNITKKKMSNSSFKPDARLLVGNIVDHYWQRFNS